MALAYPAIRVLTLPDISVSCPPDVQRSRDFRFMTLTLLFATPADWPHLTTVDASNFGYRVTSGDMTTIMFRVYDAIR